MAAAAAATNSVNGRLVAGPSRRSPVGQKCGRCGRRSAHPRPSPASGPGPVGAGFPWSSWLSPPSKRSPRTAAVDHQCRLDRRWTGNGANERRPNRSSSPMRRSGVGAAGAQQLCSTNPHEPPHASFPTRCNALLRKRFVMGAVVGIPRWHASVHPLLPGRRGVAQPRLPADDLATLRAGVWGLSSGEPTVLCF